MAESTTIRWEQDSAGIVTLILDDPAQSANTMNAAYMASMKATVDRLESEREHVTGVIITSAKRTFFAGGDLNELLAVTAVEAPAYGERVRGTNADLRRLEQLGKPVVAVLSGVALGGGLEIALAAHHRIVVNNPKIQLGLPEVGLGLLPGGNGLVRTVRLLGVEAALSEVMLSGRRMPPAEALRIGLIDELVGEPDELIAAARAFIAANPAAAQPWDRAGYVVPGGVPGSLDAALDLLEPAVRAQVEDSNYPAPRSIFQAAVEGAGSDFAGADELERRYFMALVTGQVGKNLIQANFFDLQAVSGSRGRPRDRERWVPAHVVVVGDDAASVGLAKSLQAAGVELTPEAAAATGTVKPPPKADAVTARVDPTPRAAAEQSSVELIAAATPGLPAPDLDPSKVVGLHFAPPFGSGSVLEIVTSEHTSQEALWRALDLARAVHRTPIVMRESEEFLTSRLLGALESEAATLLAEGVTGEALTAAAARAGYSAPVQGLLAELATRAPSPDTDPQFVEHPASIEERLLIRQAVEALRCVDEGLVELPADANQASLLGAGYPPWTGGVLQFVAGYRDPRDPAGPTTGREGFMTRARELSTNHGPRFEPPASALPAK